MTGTTDESPMQRMLGDLAPKFASLTDDVLFGDVWARPELSASAVSALTLMKRLLAA